VALTPGSRLGAYEIAALIGSGGMGEVYRATDTALGRSVAIKVLPTSLASDPERIARLDREARTLAALNHPNIAAIYGLEKSAEQTALVMELVEGPTLADRIAEGPVPIEDALAVAKQIAEALEAAHEQGIVHRDLKPANIKVRDDGAVKVLDFGLAKLTPSPAVASDATISPTITSPALTTGIGVLLGTAAYMSPEQAKGRPADKRADLWAFGCVLYEMLTARRAFEGEDITETLAAVMRGVPDWNALPTDVPPDITTLLERSLRKDLKTRLGDASVIRFLLERATEPQVTRRTTAGMRPAMLASVTAVVVAALSAGATWLAMRPVPPTPLQPLRFAIVPPSDQTFTLNGSDRVLALSRDGSRLVYAVGQGQLVVRATDRLEGETLRGINTARAPFISPDGQWIGFFDGAQIKRVLTTGGPPIPLCVYSGTPRGGSWGTDGRIVFATTNPTTGLVSVSQDGGEPVVLTKPDTARGELDHVFPSVLPNGRGVLYTVARAGAEVQVTVLDLRSGQQKILIRGGSHAEYVETGHLVYASGGRLHAVRFDPIRLEVQGDPRPLPEPVTVLQNGAAEFSVSRTGTLVYVPGAGYVFPLNRTLVWVDRQGREQSLRSPGRPYAAPRLSPDDTQLALIAAEQDLDVWIWDIARATGRRFTVDPTQDAMPTWAPDGQHILFSSARSGATNVYRLRAVGTGQAERLTTSTNTQFPMTISPDGKLAVLLEQSTSTGNDLSLLRLPDTSASGDSSRNNTESLLATMFNETNPSISPDGQWLAYQSNEGGSMQVYVRPFPNVNDGIWAISTSGGGSPVWGRNGKELFYGDFDGTIMAVPVQLSPSFSYGNATKLFSWPSLTLPSPARNYDVSRDGQRFLMIKEASGDASAAARASASSIVMVLNWADSLKQQP
jgi:eukaryotic-like serine/threonine-protein kinase